MGLLVWFLGGSFALLSAFGVRMVIEYNIFPLHDINGIVIDSKGRIYCESSFWGRLQVYSSSGEFMRGWFSGSSGGACQIELDDDDLIHVYTARGGNHYVYDEMGKLICKTKLKETEFYKYKKDTSEKLDHLGNRFQVRSRYLFPKIVRINSSGDIDLVIGNPLYLKLFEPISVVISVVIALILLSLVERQKRVSKKRKQTKDISAEDSIHQGGKNGVRP